MMGLKTLQKVFDILTEFYLAPPFLNIHNKYESKSFTFRLVSYVLKCCDSKWIILPLTTLVLLFDKKMRMPNDSGSVFAFGDSLNNRRAFDKLSHLINYDLSDSTCKGRRVKFIARLVATVRLYKNVKHILDACNFSIMPVMARIQSIIAIAYYIIWADLFKYKHLKHIVVANDHNPQQLILLQIGKDIGICTTYVQHAPISKFFPALNCNIAVLDDVDTAKIYLKNKRMSCDFVFVIDRLERSVSNRRYKKYDYRIGLALGYFYNTNFVADLINEILNSSTTIDILLRPHPRTAAKDLLRFKGFPRVKIEEPGRSVDEFTENISLLFVGNSGVAFECVKKDVIVYYLDGLDDIYRDYYGWVESGLVLEVHESSVSSVVLNPIPVFNEAKLNGDTSSYLEKCETCIMQLRYKFRDLNQ